MNQAIRALARRIQLLFTTGKATRVSASGLQAQVQLSDGETHDYPTVEPFGHAGFAPDGSQAIVLAKGGEREGGGLVIQLRNTKGRPDLAQGDSALHNAGGDYIWIKEDGTIEVKASKVDVQAEAVTVNADAVDLGGSGGKGVVTGDCVCPFTGNPHADLSAIVKAVK